MVSLNRLDSFDVSTNLEGLVSALRFPANKILSVVLWIVKGVKQVELARHQHFVKGFSFMADVSVHRTHFDAREQKWMFGFASLCFLRSLVLF